MMGVTDDLDMLEVFSIHLTLQYVSSDHDYCLWLH